MAQLNLARAYLYVSKLDEAVSLAAEVRRVQPHLELAVLIQAEAFNRMQRFAEAQAALLTLPEASRTTKAYWFSLGYAQQLQGLHPVAIESFMKALSIRMDDAQSHYCMGLSFFEMNLKDEACECFRTALLMGLDAPCIHGVFYSCWLLSTLTGMPSLTSRVKNSRSSQGSAIVRVKFMRSRPL